MQFDMYVWEKKNVIFAWDEICNLVCVWENKNVIFVGDKICNLVCVREKRNNSCMRKNM